MSNSYNYMIKISIISMAGIHEKISPASFTDLSIVSVHNKKGLCSFTTSRREQDSRHFTDIFLKCIFSNELLCILIEISPPHIPLLHRGANKIVDISQTFFKCIFSNELLCILIEISPPKFVHKGPIINHSALVNGLALWLFMSRAYTLSNIKQ